MQNQQTIKLIMDLGFILPKTTSKQTRRYGIFECPYCKKEFISQHYYIKIAHTQSCGCMKSKLISDRNSTHNCSKKREYKIWIKIKDRCSNPKNINYKYYGDRGISICKDWLSFECFEEWANKNGYEDGLTIDRIDNDGNYEPSNCRWVSRKIQSRNSSKLRSNNTTGYRGVVYAERNKRKFWASITVDNIPMYLGCYMTAIEAAKAYDTYVIINNLEHTINGVLFSNIER